MKIWAMVPARGGSKSIKRKNLVPVAGRPLLDWGVRAVQASDRCHRIICSTDDQDIAERARFLGIDVDWRPEHLATDDAKVADAAIEMIERLGGASPPDLLVLIQPTSPFLLPQHIDELLDAMIADPAACSGQTVTPVPHNHHAWNQREVEDGRVRFRFAAERMQAYNKQTKPKLFVFGNLVVARPAALRSGLGFFADPSVAVQIPKPYDFDLDAPEDLILAEAIVAAGLVSLTHLNEMEAQS